MHMLYDEDEWETVVEMRTCDFHKKNPRDLALSCGCGGSISHRLRPPEDVAARRAARLKEHEDRILAEADAIRARRTTPTTEGEKKAARFEEPEDASQND